MFQVPAGGTIDPSTQGFSYGYEVSGGVDIREHRNNGTAVRLRAGLWTTYNMIAGTSSYPMNGFRITMGGVFD